MITVRPAASQKSDNIKRAATKSKVGSHDVKSKNIDNLMQRNNRTTF